MRVSISIRAVGVRRPAGATSLSHLATRLGRMVRKPSTRSLHLSVAFLTPKQMAVLNARYRRKDEPTDVLSFDLGQTTDRDSVEGEVLLCPSVIRTRARAQGTPMTKHLQRLFVHGALHVLGYDHVRDRDARTMERLEERILGFPV